MKNCLNCHFKTICESGACYCIYKNKVIEDPFGNTIDLEACNLYQKGGYKFVATSNEAPIF